MASTAVRRAPSEAMMSNNSNCRRSLRMSGARAPGPRRAPARLLALALLANAAPALTAGVTGIERQAQEAIGDIYRLDRHGQETALSLRAIDWDPTAASLLFDDEHGRWFTLLESDPAHGALAVASVTGSGARRAALGANPLHDLARSHRTGGTADEMTERWFDNTIAWLLDAEMPFGPDGRAINVVLTGLHGESGIGPDPVTRRWFMARAEHITLSAPWACDGAALAGCLGAADLLVIGPGSSPHGSAGSTSIDKGVLDGALASADALGVPVLYLHEDDRLSTSVDAPVPRLQTVQALGLSAQANVDALRVVRGSAPEPHETSPPLSAALPPVR